MMRQPLRFHPDKQWMTLFAALLTGTRIQSTMHPFIECLGLSSSLYFSLLTPLEINMSTALDITKRAYEAFGRRDISALLKLVADEVDWKFVGPASWPHPGLRRNPREVAAFFADLDRFDDLTVFEPREFIEASENVTVLGYLESFARETKQKYHSDWIHVSTVRNGKITAGVALPIPRRLTGTCNEIMFTFTYDSLSI